MEQSIEKRILVVDDEEVVRSLCSRLLIPLGFYVETASDGQMALACFEKQPYDLLLTDYRMPGGMDGLELGQTIKERFPQTQIIFMTAFPAVETAVRMLRLGATDYLIKPFDPAELIKCVTSCLAKPVAG